MVAQATSAVGTLLTNLQRISDNSRNYEAVSFSVQTGRKFAELRDYRADVFRIVNYQTEMAGRNNYVGNIELVQTQIRTYDRTLEQLIATAQQVISATNNLNDITNPSQTLNNSIGNNLLLNIGATLNVRIGERYVYAGTNYETPPVTDLQLLPDLPPAESNTPLVTDPAIETNPALPVFTINGTTVSYSTLYNATSAPPVVADTNAHARAQIAVNDQRNLSYGVTANEEAIQNLIHATLRLRASGQAATGTPPITLQQRREFLITASALAETALNQLRNVHVQTAQNLGNFDVHRQAHVDTNLILEGALSKIYNADINVAATRLASLQTQIQASYSVIARQNELTLLNFLRN